MEIKDMKNEVKEYKIIPIFNESGKKIEEVIESAFLKYLKFNNYK